MTKTTAGTGGDVTDGQPNEPSNQQAAIKDRGDDDDSSDHSYQQPDKKRSRTEPAPASSGSRSSSSTPTTTTTTGTPTVQLPPLPSAVWGRILDALPYEDVRPALAAGKLLAVHAARHVRLLSIFHASELNARAARRFSNVSEVNVYSLLRYNDYEGDDWVSFCSDTARRVVPFLICFAKLTKCFVGGDAYYTREYWDLDIESQTGRKGGYTSNGKYRFEYHQEQGVERMGYTIDACSGPVPIRGYKKVVDKSHIAYRRMLAAFVDAFRAMALPPNLDLSGVMDLGDSIVNVATCNKCPLLVARDGHSCTLCREMCETFPLALVITFTVGRRSPWGGNTSNPAITGNVCISDRDRYAIIKSRDGGKDAIKKEGKRVLMQYLRCGLSHRRAFEDVEDTDPYSYRDALNRIGASTEGICYYHSDVLRRIRRLMEAGCPVPSRKELYDDFLSLRGKKLFMIKSSFDVLCAMGLPFNADDFVVIGPETDRCLAKFGWGKQAEADVDVPRDEYDDDDDDDDYDDDDGDY